VSKSIIQGGYEYPIDALKLVTLYCERPKTTEIFYFHREGFLLSWIARLDEVRWWQVQFIRDSIFILNMMCGLVMACKMSVCNSGPQERPCMHSMIDHKLWLRSSKAHCIMYPPFSLDPTSPFDDMFDAPEIGSMVYQ